MYISSKKLKNICKHKGLKLGELLEKADVSKTAFYALVRKEDILPRSIRSIASALGESPSVFLEEESPEERKIKRLIKRMNAIVRRKPNLDRDNVWHTLLLLSERPVVRLRRGLTRGRKIDFH